MKKVLNLNFYELLEISFDASPFAIRQAYKEIQARLTEIKATQQLLQMKYRQFYHRDPLRDKKITEYQFISKNAYSRFEFTLKEIEAKQKMERERLARMHKNEPSRGTF